MAVFELQGPDGKVYEVDAPDAQTAVAAFQSMGKAPEGAGRFANPAIGKANPGQMSWSDVGADVAKSAGVGLAQGALGLATLPGNVEALGRYGINAAGSVLGTPKVSTDTALVNYSDAKSAIEEGPNGTGPFYEPKTRLGKYARTAGEFAPMALGGAASLGARAGRVAAPAVVSETAGQLTEGTRLEPWARLAGALAGTQLPNVGARAVTPLPADPHRAQSIQTLEQSGVNALTAGQRTGSERMRWVEDATAMAPGGGAVAKTMQDVAGNQFTRAALQRAGINANRATPDVMNNAFNVIGREYDTIGQNVVMTADPRFTRRMTDIAQLYERNAPQISIRRGVAQLAQEVVQAAAQSGGLTGKQLTNYRSVMREMQRNARSDPDASRAIGDMLTVFDRQMVRNLPTVAERRQFTDRLQDLNRRYRNMLAIETAASRESGTLGVISPAALRSAVAGANKREYVRGRHPMADLARAGDAILKPMKSSGTAERTNANAIVGGPSSVASALAGGVATGGDPLTMLAAAAGPAALKAATARAIMSRPVQNYMGNQRMPRQMEPIPLDQLQLLAPFLMTRDQ